MDTFFHLLFLLSGLAYVQTCLLTSTKPAKYHFYLFGASKFIN
jgi:hypothetical protein